MDDAHTDHTLSCGAGRVQADASNASLPEDAVGAFPAIDRMLEEDELFAEQLKVHAAKLKAAKMQPTLAPK